MPNTHGGKHKGMFGNYFFPLFFYFQKQLSIFETKKLVWQSKINRKKKIILKTQFVKETENMQKTVFNF